MSHSRKLEEVVPSLRSCDFHTNQTTLHHLTSFVAFKPFKTIIAVKLGFIFLLRSTTESLYLILELMIYKVEDDCCAIIFSGWDT